MVFWFLGISGAGKTTLGTMLEAHIKSLGLPCYRIDGDETRAFFDNDLGYSTTDRSQNMKRIMYGAYLLSKNNIVTIVCAQTPLDNWRTTARYKIENYNEIFLKRDINTSMKNDVKGIFEGNLGKTEIVGVDIPFETPSNSDLILDTDIQTVKESFEHVREYFEQRRNDKHAQADRLDGAFRKV